MLVAGAVEIDGGNPRRARLKVIEGFGKPELEEIARRVSFALTKP